MKTGANVYLVLGRWNDVEGSQWSPMKLELDRAGEPGRYHPKGGSLCFGGSPATLFQTRPLAQRAIARTRKHWGEDADSFETEIVRAVVIEQ